MREDLGNMVCLESSFLNSLSLERTLEQSRACSLSHSRQAGMESHFCVWDTRRRSWEWHLGLEPKIGQSSYFLPPLACTSVTLHHISQHVFILSRWFPHVTPTPCLSVSQGTVLALGQEGKAQMLSPSPTMSHTVPKVLISPSHKWNWFSQSVSARGSKEIRSSWSEL